MAEKLVDLSAALSVVKTVSSMAEMSAEMLVGAWDQVMGLE